MSGRRSENLEGQVIESYMMEQVLLLNPPKFWFVLLYINTVLYLAMPHLSNSKKNWHKIVSKNRVILPISPAVPTPKESIPIFAAALRAAMVLW